MVNKAAVGVGGRERTSMVAEEMDDAPEDDVLERVLVVVRFGVRLAEIRSGEEQLRSRCWSRESVDLEPY
jgi:hypothetical protein